MRTLTLPAAGVGPIALGDDGSIAVPYGMPRWSSVAYAAPAEAEARAVAKSAWPTGLINWVAVDGDWVGYVDQSAVQSDTAPRVDWIIEAVNVRTAERVVLARSRQAEPWVPRLVAGAGVFAWSTATPDRFADTWIWRPGDSAPTKLLSDAQVGAGSEIPTDDGLIYTGPRVGSRRPVSGDVVSPGGDCWRAPYDGSSPPTPLTHDGFVMSCAITNDAVVYATHFDPSRDSSSDGELDDPFAITSQPLDGSAPRRVEEGYTLGYPLTGASFISWNGGQGRVFLTAHGQSAPDPVSGAALRAAARGTLFAYERVDHESIDVMAVPD